MRIGSFILGSMAITVLFSACTRHFDPQPSCNFVQNGDLQRVSWNSLTPMKLYVHHSLSLVKYPEMEKVVREAAQAWNDVAGRELIRVEAFNVGGEAQPRKEGYSTLYWLTSWDANKQTEQARTTIYWSGSQIYEADIRLNAQDHTFYVGSESTFTGVDLKSLLIHEFGHALGLAHATGVSVMNVSLNNGVARRKISEVDGDSIRCEY